MVIVAPTSWSVMRTEETSVTFIQCPGRVGARLNNNKIKLKPILPASKRAWRGVPHKKRKEWPGRDGNPSSPVFLYKFEARF